MNRRAVMLGGAAAACALVAAFAALGGGGNEPRPLPARVHPLLPDLAMAPIEAVDGSFGGTDLRPYLRFGATIINVGAGDFILAAHRSWPVSDDWVVTQRIVEGGGGFTARETSAGMVYGGDRHDHWHVRGVEEHRLERMDTGEVVARVVKQGFCFFDVAPAAPAVASAPAEVEWPEEACGNRLSTSLTVGLSVGWADIYPYDMIEQHMDLTGIPDGRYRIREIADPLNEFKELDETNNETWVDVEITNTTGIPRVTIVGRPATP